MSEQDAFSEYAAAYRAYREMDRALDEATAKGGAMRHRSPEWWAHYRAEIAPRIDARCELHEAKDAALDALHRILESGGCREVGTG